MATLTDIRLRLLDLHKALVDAARRDYERVHGRQSDTAFLEVLAQDSGFAWLGAFTTLIVALDEALEDNEPSPADWNEQVRRLLTPGPGGAFNEKYEHLIQQVPEVLYAHGALMQALRT